MTNKNFIRLITVIVIIFYSCSTKNNEKETPEVYYEKDLDEFIISFPVLSKYDWSIYSVDFNEDKTEVTLAVNAKRGDTTFVVALEKYVAIENDMLNNCYTIARFIKTYKEKGLIHDIYTIGGDSIMFHYYYNEETPRKRYIVEGKRRYIEYFGADSSRIYTPPGVE